MGGAIILLICYQFQEVGFIGEKIWGEIILMGNWHGHHLIGS